MTRQSNILITGATSGLGREMAEQLAARGERILATGRRAERLRALDANPNINTRALDLTSPEQIAEFLPKHRAAIRRDFKRWYYLC